MAVTSSPDVEAQIAAILGDVRREVDISHRARIFCNRNLRMASIELIGFDMDYTLALYHQERMEQTSIDLMVSKMIENHGYQPEIRDLYYEPRLAIRGLVVDTKLGNVLKMDRHCHVGRVYHGKRLLSDEERRIAYRRTRINLSQPRYIWIDTLFSLPEAVMYVTLVDYVDQRTPRPNYRKLFADIRASIDEAHRDETLKSLIKRDLGGYVVKDPNLAETLHKLRSSGKRLFLLTNSHHDYTCAVMSFLLDGERSAYHSWRQYFDWVIVAGDKPGFFTKRSPFVALDPESGQPEPGPVQQLVRDKIYQGGNIYDFEDMTGVRGEQVLYVGDHIYGDILRLRKAHMWRTAMVLQELDEDNRISERLNQEIRDLALLDRRRRNLESEIDYQVTMLKRLQRMIDEAQQNGQAKLRPRLGEAKREARRTLDSLRDRARVMEAEVQALEWSIDGSYNPYWGAFFREESENSRFGDQVSNYADLYTSRVSNFLHYSPVRYFRAPRRQMPHEV